VIAYLGNLESNEMDLIKATLYWLSFMAVIYLVFFPRISGLLGAKPFLVRFLSSNIPHCATFLGTKKVHNDLTSIMAEYVESIVERVMVEREKGHRYHTACVENKIALCREVLLHKVLKIAQNIRVLGISLESVRMEILYGR
jgi:hypothetical protein